MFAGASFFRTSPVREALLYTLNNTTSRPFSRATGLPAQDSILSLRGRFSPRLRLCSVQWLLFGRIAPYAFFKKALLSFSLFLLRN